MKLEAGKIYKVQLGSKHRHSLIKARYIEYRPEEDSHVIEMLSTVKWNGSITTLALQEKFMKEYGHGIHYIIGTEQILKEVKWYENRPKKILFLLWR